MASCSRSASSTPRPAYRRAARRSHGRLVETMRSRASRSPRTARRARSLDGRISASSRPPEGLLVDRSDMSDRELSIFRSLRVEPSDPGGRELSRSGASLERIRPGQSRPRLDDRAGRAVRRVASASSVRTCTRRRAGGCASAHGSEAPDEVLRLQSRRTRRGGVYATSWPALHEAPVGWGATSRPGRSRRSARDWCHWRDT